MNRFSYTSRRVATSFIVPAIGKEHIESWREFLEVQLGDSESALGVVRDLTAGEWSIDRSPLRSGMLARLILAMEAMFDIGMVGKALYCENRRMIEAWRRTPASTFNQYVKSDAQYVWRSDCTFICSSTEICAEAERGAISVLLDDHVVEFFLSFRRPKSINDALLILGPNDVQLGQAVGELLVRQGMLTRPDQNKPSVPTTLCWYEQLFHDRTRIKPRMWSNHDSTRAPSKIIEDGNVPVCPPAFTTPFDVLASLRQSSSDYLDIISIVDLTNLCWFSSQFWIRPNRDGTEKPRLPCPRAGGLSSLSVKCFIFDVAEVPSGIYSLSKADGRLSIISEVSNATLESVAGELRSSLGKDATWQPQALVVVEGKLEQISKKYPGLSLSLLLKEAGAFLQMMHLVAAALDVSVCAVGVVSDKLLNVIDTDVSTNSVRLLDITVGGRPRHDLDAKIS